MSKNSKPAPEEQELFENPQKLGALAPGAKQNLIDLAKKVKAEMGNTFVKIYITSVYRTKETQVNDIFMQKLEKLSGTSNMFEYYNDHIPEIIDGVYIFGSSPTLNYLNALQSKFDGTKEDEDRWKRIPEAHQKEINAVQKGDRKKVKELLLEYTGSAFKPSSHMDKPTTVADLRTKGSHKATAQKVLAYNKKRLEGTKIKYGYEAKTEGEPHVHINLN